MSRRLSFDSLFIFAKKMEVQENTKSNHKIRVVNYLNVDKIYKDLFEKLGKN